MPHIVIAEDEDDVREFLMRATRRLAPHAEVTAVPTAMAALDVFQQRGCDLLITDQRMPYMTGVELLQAVREAAPGLPVIVISADTSAKEVAIAAGATAFFYKPITIGQIRQIIEQWLPPQAQEE